MNDPPSFWHTALKSVFGSDELQSYSAVYTWQANQVAHFMMGFFLAALLYRLALPCLATPWKRWLLILSPFIVPIIKLAPDAGLISAESSFPVSWREFFADKATDIFFWYLGMFTGILVFFPKPDAGWSKRTWVICGTVLVGGVWAAYHLNEAWTEQKRGFDDSDLPTGWVRVSQYPARNLADGDQRKTLEGYLGFIRGDAGDGKTHHLIIRGGKAEDRSKLGVALGTEWASRIDKVQYVTASRLIVIPEITTTEKLKAIVIDDVISLSLNQVADAQPVPSPSYKEQQTYLKDALKKGEKIPRAQPSTKLDAREQRKATALHKVIQAILDTDSTTQNVSTVWVVGGPDGAAHEWELEIKNVFAEASSKHVIDVVHLK